MTGTALAIQSDQSEWTPQQVAAFEAIGLDSSVPNAEKAVFLAYCQRTGLDPWIKQVYMIGRKDKTGKIKYTIQTAIDGFRVTARRSADRAGATVGDGGTWWCGEDGQWVDVWLSPRPPSAAKVTVLRGAERFTGLALYSEYVGKNYDGKPNQMWSTMPANQLAKCAEAQALRKAFPNDLGGMYVDAEMAQADNVGGTTVVVQQGKPQRLTQRAVAARAEPVDVEPEPEPAAFDGDIDALLTRITTIEDRDELTKLWREYKDDPTIVDAITVQGKLLVAANA